MRLHMTEIAVADLPGAVSWYRDRLGLPLLMLDEPRRFALLGDGGRLALKGADAPATGLRLTFLVVDLDATRDHLASSGIEVSEIVADGREPFRSARLRGPEGVAITLFSWTDQPTS